MKKLLKLITLFLFVGILSGCNANYDLVIDENNAVTENFKIIIPNDLILEGNDDIEVFLDNRIESYKTIRQYKNYIYEKEVGKDSSFIEMTMKYKSLREYSNSPFLNNVFENLTVIENNKFTTFKTVGKYYYNDLYGADPSDNSSGEGLKPGSPTQITIGDVDISIKIHNKFIESNADVEDEKNNIYTWKLSKDSREEYIYLKYSNEKRYDIIFKDFISEYLNTIIVIATVTIIILITFATISLKYLKNNRV